MGRRHLRVLAVVAALASPLLLAGCDKPAPKITVQTAAFSTTITPSSYCFSATHCRRYRLELPEVSAKPDATVLIDVPRAVVDNGWRVTALSVPSLAALGAPETVHGRHSFRVAASTNNGNPFIVQVAQLHRGTPDSSRWSFLVKVSDQT